MPGKKLSDGDERPIPRNHIRAWRKSRDAMSIETLAERSGLSISTISEIERHLQDFTGRTLLAIATALGTEPGDLLSRDPLQKPNALRTMFDELEGDDQDEWPSSCKPSERQKGSQMLGLCYSYLVNSTERLLTAGHEKEDGLAVELVTETIEEPRPRLIQQPSYMRLSPPANTPSAISSTSPTASRPNW